MFQHAVKQPDFIADPLTEIVPVILAGGSGRRLWPLSSKSHPKPFLSLAGRHSLLQDTARRTVPMKPPLIVAGQDYRPLVLEHMREGQIETGSCLWEPVGRNTAAAISVAACLLERDDPVMLVLPSDHYVSDLEAFHQAVRRASPLAHAGHLVTFGVRPDSVQTRYGYIECGASVQGDICRVSSFTEKPDRKTARFYKRSGHYLWNSGIFMFTAQSFIQAMQACEPALYDQVYESLHRARRFKDDFFLDEALFSACSALSVDKAVMEKTDRAVVVPVEMGWTDLGTWPGLCSWKIRHQLFHSA